MCLCARFCAAFAPSRGAVRGQASRRSPASCSGLAAAGTLTPEDYRRRPRHLRRRQGDGQEARRHPQGSSSAASSATSTDMAARGQFDARRACPRCSSRSQRNPQYWTTQPAARLRRSACRFPRLRARLPALRRPRDPDPVAGHVRQAQRLLERRQALRHARRRAARRGRCRSPPSAPAGSRGSTCSRSTARSPPWVSSLAQGTGLQAMARVADAAQPPGRRRSRSRRAGWASSRPRRPRACACADGGGAHYLQYSGLPKLKILNGFVQSLVGLYDFAAADRRPDGAVAVPGGRHAPARTEVPTLRHRRLVAVLASARPRRESDLGYHKLLRDFLDQLCKRTAAVAVLQRRRSTSPPT